MRIKKLSTALSVVVCLAAVLIAVQPAFAKTVCGWDAVGAPSGTDAWGGFSSCTCSNISGYVRGQGVGALSFQIMTRAVSGNADNEVWSQVMEVATGGTVTRWVYQYVDNPGGGYSVAGYQGSPDWVPASGQPVRAVCAN